MTMVPDENRSLQQSQAAEAAIRLPDTRLIDGDQPI
jgi:hypothetical protein